MLGKKLFEWTDTDIIRGMSSSDNVSDGGFSPLTDHMNPIAVPGTAYAPAAPTDNSTNLSGTMIASCEDPSGSYGRLFVSSDPSSQDGRFYSMSTSYVLTQRGSTDSSHNYIQGKTDMIAFGGEAYITNDATLVRWSSIGSSNTFDTAFFSFNSALAPHPALVYNGFAYYGDGNLLQRQSAANVTPVTILTLSPGTIIVALGIDPGSGNMLISVIGQLNLSDTLNSGASVLFYNGSSASFQRTVQVDDMVTAFANTEGALYVGYGQNFGTWNGSGITFLRHMNIGFDNTQLLYKHHFTSIGSTLYMIEKYKIIAYGPVRQKGDNVFYSALSNVPGGTPANLTTIVNVGQNVLAYSYETSKFFTWDSLATTSSAMALFTNSYDFDNEYWIRWIRLVWATQVNNNVDPGSMRIRDQDGVVGGLDPSYFGLYDLRNTSGAASAVKDIININKRLKQIQLEILQDTVNPGIRRIIVYGEEADRT